MDKSVQDFVQGKRIAVVGVSHDPKKLGNTIYKELKERGFEVYAVNPALDGIAGDPCYPSLAALKDKVDGAVVCVQPARVSGVLREAAKMGLPVHRQAVRKVVNRFGAGRLCDPAVDHPPKSGTRRCKNYDSAAYYSRARCG